MISHDESLEMENRWAIEFCVAPTLESDEKDSTNEHGTEQLPRGQREDAQTRSREIMIVHLHKSEE